MLNSAHTIIKFSRLTLISILLTVALMGVLPVPLAHASFTVNSTTDAVDANIGNGICETATAGQCTLRAAIQEANALAGGDTISLPAGTYTLTITGTGEDASVTGDLDITTNLTITGAGAGTTIIDGNSVDRVLHVVSGNFTLSGVTIKGGNSASDGGGLYIASGTTTISNSTFTSNSATGSTWGGGIYSGGTLTISNSTFSSNSATRGGGIYNFWGTLNVSNSTFTSNNTTQLGGGIFNNSGTSTISNSTFSSNSATSRGGGIYNSGGTSNVSNSTFSGNSAGSAGGGVHNNSGTTTLKNTIVANSTSGGNCGGTITDGGNNLDSANTCSFGGTSKINTNPNLGALIGSPQYFPLNTGSAAIDAGDNTICAAIPVSNQSQGGLWRPTDGDGNGTATCDIGSYEASAVVSSSSPSIPAEESGGGYLGKFFGQVHLGTYGQHYQGKINFTINGDTLCFEVPAGFEAAGPTCFTDKEGGRKDFFIKLKAAQPAAAPIVLNGVPVGAGGGTFNLGTWQLSIPANLLPDGSRLQLDFSFNSTFTAPNGLRLLAKLMNAKIVNNAGGEIKTFNPPLQLCYTYNDAELAGIGGDPKNFVILTSNDGVTTEQLTTSVDTVNKKVCANVTHFSLFEIAARTPTKIPTTGDMSTPLWIYGIVLLLGAGAGWLMMKRRTI